jgi:uncharacterized OB-fold protein
MGETTADVPLPVRDELSGPYWDALAQGQLTFQRCRRCGHVWLPARSECPRCLECDWAREIASGDARLVSWVVYHHAFHPAFAERLPYTVAVVELAEGPRLISNVIDAGDPETLTIDRPLRLIIERAFGISIPRFIPA